MPAWSQVHVNYCQDCLINSFLILNSFCLFYHIFYHHIYIWQNYKYNLMFIITWVWFFLEHYLYQTSKKSSIINENRSKKNGFRMLLSLRSYNKPTCWGVLDLFGQRSGLLPHSPPHVWVNKGATTDKSVNSKYCNTQVSHLKVLRHTSQ